MTIELIANRAALAEILHARHFDPAAYSLAGGDPNDAVCLDRVGATWVVYYTEMGDRSDERSFATEAEACTWFLAKISSLGGNRAL